MTTTTAKIKAVTNIKTKSQIKFIIILFAVLVLCDILTAGKLLRFGNIVYIIAHSIFYTFVSWGMIFIFTTGITDLSIGANVILAANIGAICAMDLGMGYVGLIFVTVIAAACFELLSVMCSIGLRIPSWISGLGMTLIFEAILDIYAAHRAVTVGSNVITLSKFRALGNIPVMILFLVAGFIVSYILFNRTTLGFNIAAVGGNQEVAKAMGIKIKKTIITGAFVGGLLIGIGGLLQVSYVGKMYPQSGMSSLSTIFRSLAILLLGQSFSNIFTMPVSVLICGILVNGLFNFLTMMGVPSGTGQEMCLGALVIVCGIISHWKYRGVVK